jgi:hypothetical protein
MSAQQPENIPDSAVKPQNDKLAIYYFFYVL